MKVNIAIPDFSAICYQSKLHVLRNPMMYTFPSLTWKKLQEARITTYKTSSFV